MKFDILMFAAMLTALASSGVHALLPQEVRHSQPIILEPRPVSERVAVLERDYEHMGSEVKDLRDDLRRETEEIKRLLREQNDKAEKWILYAIGMLVMGDRGWAIFKQRPKMVKEDKP